MNQIVISQPSSVLSLCIHHAVWHVRMRMRISLEPSPRT